jgi:hypothetical protein
VPIDGATSGTRKILGARFLTNASVTGTGNVVFDISPTFPGNLTITGNATPSTTTAGTISFDTNAWATSRGSFQTYDGTANIILLGALASDTPSNGQVPTWNTAGTITWETPPGGMGGNYTVTGNIVASSGNVTIASASNENIILDPGSTGETRIVGSGNTTGDHTIGGNINVTGSANFSTVNAVTMNVTTLTGNILRRIIANGTTMTINNTGNFTINPGDGVTIAGNATNNSMTINSTGGSGADTGDVKFILDSASVPAGWALTGVNGIPAYTGHDADYKPVIKMAGTVATPTFSPAAGAVASGTTITISSGTSGVTFMTTNNTTDPSRSVGTAGATWTISANQTIESMAYKDGAYLIDSAVASAAYTVTAGIPTPDLLHWPLNGPPGATITASVGPGSTTNTGTLNNDFLAMAVGNGTFQSSANVTYSTNIVTLALWLRVPNLTNYAPILRSQYINDVPRWELSLDGGWLRCAVVGATGYRGESIYAPIGTATWGHIAVVFSNSTAAGDIKLYINGALASPDITSDDKTGTANFAAGLISVKSIFADNAAFDLDDVRLYAGELTSGQISAIHAAGRP